MEEYPRGRMSGFKIPGGVRRDSKAHAVNVSPNISQRADPRPQAPSHTPESKQSGWLSAAFWTNIEVEIKKISPSDVHKFKSLPHPIPCWHVYYDLLRGRGDFFPLNRRLLQSGSWRVLAVQAGEWQMGFQSTGNGSWICSFSYPPLPYKIFTFKCYNDKLQKM